MYLVTFYSDNLCFKWRFEQEALSGKICQKWEDFMSLREDWETCNETGGYLVRWGELAGLS